MSRKIKQPNPGTKEAIKAGCSCPVLDNQRGRGYYGDGKIFVYVEGCIIHDKKRK